MDRKKISILEVKSAVEVLFNCNVCENIDYTEQEQHKQGISVIPEHHCMYYNVRVLHADRHKGENVYITPCKQCKNDGYKHFK